MTRGAKAVLTLMDLLLAEVEDLTKEEALELGFLLGLRRRDPLRYNAALTKTIEDFNKRMLKREARKEQADEG